MRRRAAQVAPGLPQISDGLQHTFAYDHVFGGGGEDPDALFHTCVAPLTDGLFAGINGSVLAYGQTGSGKTYTMGSAFTPGAVERRGVIPRSVDALFARIAATPSVDFTVRCQFVEVHNEVRAESKRGVLQTRTRVRGVSRTGGWCTRAVGGWQCERGGPPTCRWAALGPRRRSATCSRRGTRQRGPTLSTSARCWAGCAWLGPQSARCPHARR